MGRSPKLLLEGRRRQAGATLKEYMEWFWPGSVYVEVQRNFCRATPSLSVTRRDCPRCGRPDSRINDVHYHDPERYRLQHALVAARLNTTMERALPHIRPTNQLSLKTPAQMQKLFEDLPEAIANSLRIAEKCEFDLSTGLGYTLPEPAVPAGYTAESYLSRLCSEAALRRSGTVTPEVEAPAG